MCVGVFVVHSGEMARLLTAPIHSSLDHLLSAMFWFQPCGVFFCHHLIVRHYRQRRRPCACAWLVIFWKTDSAIELWFFLCVWLSVCLLEIIFGHSTTKVMTSCSFHSSVLLFFLSNGCPTIVCIQASWHFSWPNFIITSSSLALNKTLGLTVRLILVLLSFAWVCDRL